MKLHRFIGKYDLSQKEVEITDIETIKQIRAVLRLEEGDKIILCDGSGTEAEAIITSLSHNKIICEIEKILDTNEPERKVSLYIAILKKENFELAVQKAVECGVANIIPVITERTIKTGLNNERLEKIIREASEQSGRSIVPKLFEIMNFIDALENGKSAEEKIIFHLVENKYMPDKNANLISIFVGPEGGFTEKEIILAQESGYTPASLGRLTLRGETAGIVATYRAVNKI
ncbi:MAG: RsmE family RNA methyltransferase [Patescibacteria group bacterium]